MSDELFPYQKKGIKWLKDKTHALLADEMGLGKTVQAIKAADEINAVSILVVCMSVGRVNWQREFEKWSTKPREFSILREGKDTPKAGHVVICTYDHLADHTFKFKNWTWDLVIFDEAHMIKSPGAKRTKAALGNAGVVRNTKRFWFLTGTPAPNHFAEMWCYLYVCGLTTRTYTEFAKHFCNILDTEHGPRVLGNKMHQLAEMKKLLKNFMLRRQKEKGMLPEMFLQNLVVEPGVLDLGTEEAFFEWGWPEDRKAELKERLEHEAKVIDQALSLRAEGKGQGNAQILEGLANSTSTLRRYIGLQKIQPIADIVSIELEAKAYEKIVIFAVHRDVIEGLRKRLAKFGAVTLYGRTHDEDKQKNIDKFQKNKNTRVFIGNILAAGTTINLTKASQVLFAEMDWVPGNNAQAMMRVHRYGQLNPVTVRFASVFGSVDEKVTATLKRKAKELTAIFDDSLDESEVFETPEEFKIPAPPNHTSDSFDSQGHENISLILENHGANKLSELDEDDIFS